MSFPTQWHFPTLETLRIHPLINYTSGALFGVAWLLFLDAAFYNHSALHTKGEEWAPMVLTTAGLILLNMVRKDTLLARDGSEPGLSRICFILGVSVMAGGLAWAAVLFSHWRQNVELEKWLGERVLTANCMLFAICLLWWGLKPGGQHSGIAI